jgi:hypothetical protein
MPSKTKTTLKTVKAAAKVKPVVRKAVAKAKTATKPVPKRASATPKSAKQKTSGLLDSVKHGVQSGLEAVGDLVKKITPAALQPGSARTKRK